MKIFLILVLAFFFYGCHNTDDKKMEIKKSSSFVRSQPVHFQSPNANYRRDSTFIAATVWQFIYKQVSPFHYYTTFNVPLEKITIDVDSIFYSPDSLKIFAFVIETDPDVRHDNIDKYVYSGNSIIGFRTSLKSYWTLYNFDQFSIAGLESYNDVRNSFRNFYLSDSRFKPDEVFGKFKDGWHYYWDIAKQDYISIPFEYNIDDKIFWDSCIIWKRGIPIPGYYSFQVHDQSKPEDEKVVILMPKLDYADSLLKLYK